MKTKLIIISLGLAAILFVTGMFVVKNSSTGNGVQSAVNENVSLVVYRSPAYTSPAYNNSLAKLHVTIEKVDAAGKRSIVWNKTFDSKYLSQYPSVQDAIKQNVEISNLVKKKEYLVLKYDIIYNSQGSELQMQSDVLLKDDSSRNVTISI